jgi:hypothetical protein
MGYVSDAQRKAVHASKADGGKGAPAKKIKPKTVKKMYDAAVQGNKDKIAKETYGEFGFDTLHGSIIHFLYGFRFYFFSRSSFPTVCFTCVYSFSLRVTYISHFIFLYFCFAIQLFF